MPLASATKPRTSTSGLHAGTDPQVLVLDVPAIIVCVDCGGRAHLLTYLDDEVPLRPGDVVAYRCEDCLDRWDIELPDDEDSGADDSGGAPSG